ncbi:hypothetical protein [Desulfurivibrio alkaliphilus]|uniref:Uncharacterized protein n=1 Tax=Desulfurivibrio alkaliphilus (strain DSM 19089 / UNIQEM U267 / AHT2) TaxID=589865 RepID=D6Z2U8_DESAT|nr:hypothetical protein [Desulfurivibrio alkaliphilus]ADH85873.1 conserved hypothetical protein [Desulfurivibrio alkaliphilus AHT 2]
MPLKPILILVLFTLLTMPASLAMGQRLQHPLLDEMPPGEAALVKQAFAAPAGELPTLLSGEGHGKLAIAPPDRFVYAIIDGKDLSYPYRDENGDQRRQQAFTQLTAKVSYQSPEPGETGGELFAVARYRLINNYRADLSHYPPAAADIDADYSYSFAEGGLIDGLSHDPAQEFLFDFSTDPIPVGISDLTLYVVFRGAAAQHGRNGKLAMGVRELSEPDHHVFWNSSDQVVIDKQLYTAEQIRRDPELFSYVDFNNNGILNEEGEPYIDPYPVSFEVIFSAREPQKGAGRHYLAAAIRDLPPARHSRLIVLTDQPAPQTSWITAISYDDPRDRTAWVVNHYAFQSAAVRTSPRFFASPLNPEGYAYRGIRQHHFLAEFQCSIIDRQVVMDPDPCPDFATERPAPKNPAPYPVQIHQP